MITNIVLSFVALLFVGLLFSIGLKFIFYGALMVIFGGIIVALIIQLFKKE